MKFNFKLLLLSVVVILLVFAATEPAAAQCAMCRATSETNLRAGGGDPKGLNQGILYMFLLPYIIIGGMGIWWWKNKKSE
jgi:hypothetical protein